MLIHNAGNMGRGVPIADSALDLQPKSQLVTNSPGTDQNQNQGEDTDVATLKSLEEQLTKETDEAKKVEIQKQITELQTKIAAKIEK
tara:strand:- start:44 stop:304 length:261 start_codon:yes stop_codon:yes gene_type:complete